MRQFSFYLPIIRDSDKKPHDNEMWMELESTMLKRYGGFSRLADVSGAWLDDKGNVIADVSRVYSLGIQDEIVDDFKAGFIPAIRRAFDQQCIYVAETGIAELV